jgi:hypothetical protein
MPSVRSCELVRPSSVDSEPVAQAGAHAMATVPLAKALRVRRDGKPWGYAGEQHYQRRAKALSGVPKKGRFLRRRGKRDTPEFRSYLDAVSRCCDPASRDFQRYGGRGVVFHSGWLGPNGFDAFMDHVGPRPPGHTLGRIDNERGYEPGNVRWETWVQQANNRSNNHRITLDGETLTAAEWARRAGLPRRQVVTNRIQRGWAPKAAVFGRSGESKAAAHERLCVLPTR